MGKNSHRIEYNRHVVLSLLWGPTITTDQSDPLNTWDSNFKAVYHLGDGSTVMGTDSTGQAAGTKTGRLQLALGKSTATSLG